MIDAQFWDHIRASRTEDPEEHAENLADRLAELPVAEILAFGKRWVELQGQAFRRESWAAAYLINGGCDSDDVPEFLDWLILQGESVYQAALANMDTLADVVDNSGECMVEASPAYEAYCMASEQDDYTDALVKQFPELTAIVQQQRRPVGPVWPFNPKEFRARLPRLANRFLADS